ncbi:MAG: hypothetical protein WCF85_14760 [Rhodospirillaceae bacterium]
MTEKSVGRPDSHRIPVTSTVHHVPVTDTVHHEPVTSIGKGHVPNSYASHANGTRARLPEAN